MVYCKAMLPSSFEYPPLPVLARGMAAGFQRAGIAHGRIQVLDRRPNDYGGSFPAEILTCRVDDEQTLRVFCKYETGASAGSRGHRGGVVYEAQVYQEFLHGRSTTAPRFYGSCLDEATGLAWLAVEYLDDSLPVNKAREPDAIVRAARWIGDFHATTEVGDPSKTPCFLLGYDPGYYLGWAERTLEFTRSRDLESAWLSHAVSRFAEVASLLLDRPLTVIHGEYYPRNIRCQNGVIRPIDWESTAIAAGEIDLACLVEAWSPATVDGCVREYCRARWPGGQPGGHDRRLDAARAYMQCRWLGSQVGWKNADESRWRLGELQAACERLGLI